ncbi:MAG: PQQ-binding-like beta-propeller repeat protein, partial [Rhodospirillales bacterium]
MTRALRHNRGNAKQAMRRLAIIIIVALGLGACAFFEKEIQEPLPGERISVMMHQATLSPDPELVDKRILLPAPSPNRDWPQSGGYANHAMHHIQVRDSLQENWSVDIGAGKDDKERLNSSPVVADGMVFAIDAESSVSAFDAATGSRVWEAELTPDDEDDGHISGGIAYERGRLYVTTGFAEVIALNAKTGAEVWRRSIGSPMRTAPTVRGGRVFVTTVDNRLLALTTDSGEELWAHTGLTEVASVLGGASPAVDSGVVVVPYACCELVALKVDNGRVLWQDSLLTLRRTGSASTLSQIRGRPIIDRGRVIAISHGGVIAAIDLRMGRRIWDKEIGGLESPWVAGDYIFILTNDNEIACISRDDGRIHWVRALQRYEDPEDRDDPIIWTGPVLASDRLIVAGSNGEALAISPYTGNILGVVEMPDGVSVPPVIADGAVYFLADDAELVA